MAKKTEQTAPLVTLADFLREQKEKGIAAGFKTQVTIEGLANPKTDDEWRELFEAFKTKPQNTALTEWAKGGMNG